MQIRVRARDSVSVLIGRHGRIVDIVLKSPDVPAQACEDERTVDTAVAMIRRARYDYAPNDTVRLGIH